MANITKRIGKNGDISYRIRVLLSENKSGNQIIKSMTWKPNPGMTARQMDKASKEEAVKFEMAVKNGLVCFDGNTTFEEYAEAYMKTAQLAPKTRAGYDDCLKRIYPAIGHIKLSKLQGHHLDVFYSNLAEAGVSKTGSYAISKRLKEILKIKGIKGEALEQLAERSGVCAATIYAAKNGKRISLVSAEAISNSLECPTDKLFEVHNGDKGLSSRTIQAHHKLISVVLAKAKKERIVMFNVAQEHATAPKLQRNEARYYNEKDAAAFVSTLFTEKDVRIKTSLLLLIFTGVRRGELCGLEWRDIDFDKGMIHVRRARQFLTGKGTLVVPTKNRSSERSIKLAPAVFEVLTAYRSWWLQQKLMNGSNWAGIEEALFIQDDGKPINPDTINGWLGKFTKANSLPDINPHGLRHTFATLQITGGVDIRTLQARTGHSQASTLTNIYAHELKSAAEAASDLLDNMLLPKATSTPVAK